MTEEERLEQQQFDDMCREKAEDYNMMFVGKVLEDQIITTLDTNKEFTRFVSNKADIHLASEFGEDHGVFYIRGEAILDGRMQAVNKRYGYWLRNEDTIWNGGK